MAKTILDMLEGAAARFGDAPYVARKTDQGWVARGFREVARDAEALAARLLDLGLKRNQPVAILSEGSPNWVIGELGILKAGGVSVPLSIQLLPREIQFRLEHSEAWGVLVSHNQLEKLLAALGGNRGRLKLLYLEEEKEERAAEDLSRHGPELLVFDRLLAEGRELLRAAEAGRRLAALRAEIGPDDVATISYTSGTTGQSEGHHAHPPQLLRELPGRGDHVRRTAGFQHPGYPALRPLLRSYRGHLRRPAAGDQTVFRGRPRGPHGHAAQPSRSTSRKPTRPSS